MLTLKHSIICFRYNNGRLPLRSAAAQHDHAQQQPATKALKARAFLAPTGLKHCAI